MDQAIGCIDNVLGRTVVALQLKDAATGVDVLKLQDIVDIGTAKRIDTLCIVAHHTKVAMSVTELLHNQMLCKVGILILVHQHIAEIVLIFFQHFGMISE